MITHAERPRVRRVCALARGGAAVSWEPSAPGRPGPGLATCAAFLLLATGCALRVRQGLVAELRRSREIAGATQQVLLRPLPGRMDGLALAAAQLSASRGAAVGGDLYEAVTTAYGVRVLIGDVRGHGLPALGAAAAVLGSFREAAHDEPEPAGVLRRMERSLERHLSERARAEPPSASPQRPRSTVAEEFVTVLLLQIAADGSVEALNCGHPWPYRLGPAPASVPPARTVRPLAGGETLPPLGVVPCRRTSGPGTAGRSAPARSSCCTPTAPRTPGTAGAASSRCGASSRGRRRPRPRGWSRACTPHCCATPGDGSRTT